MQNNSKKFKKFKKAPLLFSLIFLLACCGALVFIYTSINKNEGASSLAQGEWQTEATRRDEIRSLERSIKEIEKERAEVETHFAQASNPVPFLDTIENLAVVVGAEAEVQSVDVSEDNTELRVSIQTSGSFDSTYKFIRLLENSPYELEIDSFEIKKTAGADWSGFFRIKLLSFVQ